jgi:hypothetical protein
MDTALSYEHCIKMLKDMFPELDEEILLSALFQNENKFENAINSLLAIQSEMNKQIVTPQKEISIFSNTQYYNSQSNNINKDTNNNKQTKPEPKVNNNTHSSIPSIQQTVIVNQPKKSFGQKVAGNIYFN